MKSLCLCVHVANMQYTGLYNSVYYYYNMLQYVGYLACISLYSGGGTGGGGGLGLGGSSPPYCKV